MKNRHGQALIIVVIIIAIIMAVFANSLNTQLRYHAQEETEIYQREQALYLAEMGINQMIFNINSGTTYNDGDTITGNFSGIGNYTTTYHTPDDSGFDGTSYIESAGTAGRISRKVFASVQPGNSSDAFKYCLYTKEGGYTKTNNGGYTTITFTNEDYGGNYYYNSSAAATPYPDWNWYTDPNNYPQGVFVQYNKHKKNASYNPFTAGDDGKVVFIHYTKNKASAKLTINFTGTNTSSINLLIITDYPNVVFQKTYEVKTTFWGTQYENVEWDPIYYDSNHQYPVFIHKPSLTSNSSVLFDEDNSKNDGLTFTINGLTYSNSPAEFEYGGQYYGFINIKGELIAKSLTTDYDYAETQGWFGTGDINGDGRYTTETIFDYDPDGHSNYFLYPPPHFIVPNGLTSVSPGSFREEY